MNAYTLLHVGLCCLSTPDGQPSVGHKLLLPGGFWYCPASMFDYGLSCNMSCICDPTDRWLPLWTITLQTLFMLQLFQWTLLATLTIRQAKHCNTLQLFCTTLYTKGHQATLAACPMHTSPAALLQGCLQPSQTIGLTRSGTPAAWGWWDTALD
jgi:hypothetical protein